MIAAGIILRSPSGSILFLKRSAAGDAAGLWALPGGKQEDGETLDATAVRETLEETGYNVGSPGNVVCRRVKDGVDFTTFLKNVDAEFIPKLNEEHTAFAWLKAEDALAQSTPAPIPAGTIS